MDADGLPIVGSGVDFSKVKPIDRQQLLAFINHYVIHTVRFLNKFSVVCEGKMMKIEEQLHRLEITLNILESKLSSIPGLDDIKVEPSAASSAEPLAPSSGNAENTSQPAPTTTTTSTVPPPAPTIADTNTPQPPPPAPAPEPDVPKVFQDARYIRFFKMLNVGVPAPAIKIKMAAEGLDPSLLDTPDAPAPAGAAKSAGDSSDSEAEFTDSD